MARHNLHVPNAEQLIPSPDSYKEYFGCRRHLQQQRLKDVAYFDSAWSRRLLLERYGQNMAAHFWIILKRRS